MGKGGPVKYKTTRNGRPHGQKKSPEVKERILNLIRQGKTPGEAGQAVNVSRQSIFTWRKDDQEFDKAFREAVEEGVDMLEAEARRRGAEGIYKDVWYKGEVVGQEIEYSDMLLALMLKGRRPEVYRERHEFTGADGGPMETKLHVEVTFVKAVNGKPA